MKKYILFAFVAILMFAFASCGDQKKSREERVDEFRSELTAEDTATMLKLCDNAMEDLKAKQYDKVLSNMYEYIDSPQQVKPLSEELKRKYGPLEKVCGYRSTIKILFCPFIKLNNG